MKNRVCFTLCALLIASTVPAQGAVTITGLNSASPYAGQTVQLALTLTNADATNTLSSPVVTITPPTASGSPVTFAATTITPATGASRRVIFSMPQSLATSVPLSNSTVSVSANGGAVVTNTFTFTIGAVPVMSNVSPGAATQGTTLSVVATLKNTAWSPAAPGQVSVFFSGQSGTVPTAKVTAFDSAQQKATLTVTIPVNATLGLYAVCATLGPACGATDPRIATGFLVSGNAALSLSSLTPSILSQCGSVNVQIAAANTNFTSLTGNLITAFTQGSTWANFGDGVTVNSVSVTDKTHAVANISVDCLAPAGNRNVIVFTGTEYATGLFAVTSNNVVITTVAPSSAPQGTNRSIALHSPASHWTQSGTVVSFGGAATVGAINVTSPNDLTASISIPQSATPGTYSITAATGGELAGIVNGFTVTAAAFPVLTSCSPSSVAQGATIPFTFATTNTDFAAHPPTFDFGANITVTPEAHPTGSTTSPVINVAPIAVPGLRTVALSSNGTNLSCTLSVTAAPSLSLSANPSSGVLGTTVNVTVTGTNTHWADGPTKATFPPNTPIQINRLDQVTPTSARLNLTIPSGAQLGTYSLQMATGGEVVQTPFTLTGCYSSLAVSPANAMPGQSVALLLQATCAQFTSQTLMTVTGGISIRNAAPYVPSFSNVAGNAWLDIPSTVLPGQYSVSVITPTTGGGAQTLTAQFSVITTPAVIVTVSPNACFYPGTSGAVTIGGQYTHFDSSTAVFFGPDITSVGTPTAPTSTQLTQAFNISTTASRGWHGIYVNTGAEQLTSAFSVCQDPSPVVPTPSVPNPPSPPPTFFTATPLSALQGQGPVSLTLTGTNTNFAFTDIPIFGQGINLVSGTWIVASPTLATAQVNISPTTPIGSRGLEIVTPLASGGVNVLGGPSFYIGVGPAQITSVTAVGSSSKPLTVNQGATALFHITGSGTNFLNGATTVNFGSGITVTTLTVNSPTDLTGQINVGFSSPTGLRGITVTTLGEIAASSSDVVLVNLSQPASLSVSPNSAPQGTAVTLLLQGTGTTWAQNQTSFSFGSNNGLNVGGWTVNATSQQATATLTIDGTTYLAPTPGNPYCYPLTVTTNHGGGTIEIQTLLNAFCVTQGAAIISSVSPQSGGQGTTQSLSIVGTNTNFQAGVTTATLGAGVSVTGVTVTDKAHATLSIAVGSTAATGLRDLTLTTLGETASYSNAFTVTPGTPTLNGVSPTSAQQGQTATLTIIGQYTHWKQGTTTATFGAGVTPVSFTIVDSQAATAVVTIDPLAYTGSRSFTLTTGTEIVSGSFFSITPGGAALSTISPATANQGASSVLVQLTGIGTHWLQNHTTFQMTGDGITVNGLDVTSATTAVAEITISPIASLGKPRSIYMATDGENVALNSSFVITGGPSVPAISCVQPNVLAQGQTHATVQICGLNTQWTAASTHILVDSDLTLLPDSTINNSTNLSAVVNVSTTASTTKLHPFQVQTGTQILTGYIKVVAPASNSGGTTVVTPTPTPVLPPPYISYVNTYGGLVSQTLDINISGRYTNWVPGSSSIVFGTGVTLNSFQILGTGSAYANITIAPNAAPGTRTVTLTTTSPTASTEVETFPFSVMVGTPAITLIDPSTLLQGQTRDVDIVGQFTSWSRNTVWTSSCPGITFSNPRYNGTPFSYTLSITAAPTAPTGSCSLTATTGTEVVTPPYGLQVSTGIAVISAVTPNIALQGATVNVHVTGSATHWNAGTTFNFGSGITATLNPATVTATDADVTLTLASLASIGLRSISAQTGGESAYLNNAFVVQVGTPLLLSANPSTAAQQANFSVGILSQFMRFTQVAPTVSLGPGINNLQVSVTSDNAISVTGSVDPLAIAGSRDITVTAVDMNGITQTLKLFGAFTVTTGPAALTSISPVQIQQGQSLVPFSLTGTNTHFATGYTTQPAFGGGIILADWAVASPTQITGHLSVPYSVAVGSYGAGLATLGEAASGAGLVAITPGTPVISLVVPAQGTQGQTLLVELDGSFVTWTASTSVSFGTGITVNSTGLKNGDPTRILANITISPTATAGSRTVAAGTVSLGSGFQVLSEAYTGTPFTFVSNAGSLTGYSLDETTGILSSTTASPFTGFTSPFGLATCLNGQILYAADAGASKIKAYSVTPVTGALAAIPGSPFTAPTDSERLVAAPDGRFLYAGTNTSPRSYSAFSVDPATGALAVPNGITIPGSSLAIAPAGYFAWAGSSETNTVTAYTVNTATGAFSTTAPAPLSVSNFRAIAVSPSGKFAYVLTNGSVGVYSIDPVTAALTSSSSATTGNSPVALVFTPNGQFAIVANNGSDGSLWVYSVNASTGALSAVSGSPYGTSPVSSVTTDSYGKYVYATGISAANILAYAVNPTTGVLTPTTAQPYGTGTAPQSIMIAQPGTFVSAIAPTAGPRAATSLQVAISGHNTHFDNTTSISFTVNGNNLGIAASSVNVVSPTYLTATLTISGSAPLGFQDINVSTGGEILTLPAAFNVTPLPLVVSQTLPFGTTGIGYSQTIVSSGAPPYTITPTYSPAISPTPSLNSSTGVFSFTPAAAGTYQVSFQIVDSQGQTASTPAMTLNIYNPLTISTTSLPAGITGTAYSQTIAASGGLAPLAYSVTSGSLPANLTINSQTGVISGTPTAPGTSNFTIQVLDALSQTKTVSLQIGVYSPLTVTHSLPFGLTGTTYSQTVVSGGAQPYTITPTYSPGISPTPAISSSTGVFSFAPSSAGSYQVGFQVSDSIGQTASASAISLNIYNPLTISTTSLPTGITGTTYSQTVSASGGLAPLAYSVTSGSMPANLTLNSQTGVISGTPTATGTSNFTIQVLDALSQTKTVSLQIGVYSPLTVTHTLPFGLTGTPYSQTVVSGGAQPYTITPTYSPAISPTPAISSSTGVFSFTPSATGSYQVGFQVSDSSGQTASASAISLNIYNPLTISTTSLPPVILGNAYSQTIAASGGLAPLTFTLASGTLPSNLSLNSQTGVISGTPNVAGISSFNIQVKDSLGLTSTVSLQIGAYSPLVISTTGLPAGRKNVAYSQSLDYSGGVPPLTSSVNSGALPDGITLNGSAIAGNPTTPGTYNWQLKVVDSANGTVTQNLSLVINDVLTINTTSLPAGTTTYPYSQTIQISNAVSPASFSISAGSLPTNLNLNASTGAIAGTPTQTGTFNFTVLVTDAQNGSASATYSIVITPAPVFSSISPSVATAGQSATVSITTLNTHFLQGTTAVSLGAGVTVNSLTVNSATSLTAALSLDPNAAPGSRDLTITTGTETLTATVAFNVAAPNLPAITSVSPDGAKSGQTVSVTVQGSNLAAATFSVSSSGGTIAQPTISSDGTSATMQVTAGANAGSFNIIATTAAGTSNSDDRSHFIVLTTTGSAEMEYSIVNTSAPTGSNATQSSPLSVLNASAPTGGSGVQAPTLSVLNTSSPAGSNVSPLTSLLSVLNLYQAMYAEALPVSVKRTAATPNAQTLLSNPSVFAVTKSTQTVPGLRTTSAPVTDVIAGETIEINVPGARESSAALAFNGIALDAPVPVGTQLFTVPANTEAIQIRATMLGAEAGLEYTPLTLKVHPDAGRTVRGTLLNQDGTPAAGRTVLLRTTGLQAEYFDWKTPLSLLPDLTGRQPGRTGFVSALNLQNPRGVFGEDPLGTGMSPDYAARFSGEINIETAGVHTFLLEAHAGARLLIDGKTVIDLAAGSAAESSTATLELTAGRHLLEVTHFEAVAAPVLRLQWERPGQPRAVVAPNSLSPSTPWTAVTNDAGQFEIKNLPAILEVLEIRAVCESKCTINLEVMK